jgi:hypothetical protein
MKPLAVPKTLTTDSHEIALSRDYRDLSDDDLLTIAGMVTPPSLLSASGG